MKADDDLYQLWIAERRSERADPAIADRVMDAVMDTVEAETPRQLSWVILFTSWIERSRFRRVAACAGAMLVGSASLICVGSALLL